LVVLHGQAELIAGLRVEHEHKFLPESLQEEAVEALLSEDHASLHLTLASQAQHVVHRLLGQQREAHL